MIYVAADGNYGSAENLVIIDTTNWTADDWELLDTAGDSERIETALQINATKENN